MWGGTPPKEESIAKSPPVLDLHGYTTDEVFDAVEIFLRQHQNQPRVHIMPGKGTGKVRQKVLEYLKLARYDWSALRDDKGRVNEGVLVVHMR